MIRRLLLLLVICMASPVWAQTAAEPILKTSLEEDSAIPGQPLIYRVTVLAPTWMPKPPVFPSFEVPNVLVRLPSRASQPASERIDGETWSGVSRAYRLYPMVPGTIRIPAGTIKVTYADPQTRDPIETELTTNAFDIHGVVPSGAEDLQPFLAAQSLDLKRTVEGDPANLKAGDALIVKTTVTVRGVPPMFVPPVTPDLSLPGLSFYAQSPGLEESENRGLVSGTRTETVTIVAENAGTYQIPQVTLSWYDLEKKAVESATVPALDLAVSGASRPQAQSEAPTDWRTLAAGAGALAVLGAVFFFAVRRYGPRVLAAFSNLQKRLKASEWYAFRQFQKALRTRDYSQAMQTALIWRDKIDPKGQARGWTSFGVSISQLGIAKYGHRSRPDNNSGRTAWDVVRRRATDIRRELKSEKRKDVSDLPPLNPAIRESFNKMPDV
ncbi:BatD family protein [Roseibium sp.]|uniref:BatD family protein n=1 Tax=Roseibium sp. TaxID=1936156 RepID=UPI003D11905E